MLNRMRKYILPLALIYFISPIDLIPLFPADDLLVAALALVAYVSTGKSNPARPGQSNAGQDDDDDVITTSWSVVEEND